MSEKKLKFTRRLNILGNLALLTWTFLAFVGVLFYNQLFSWLYLIVELILIYGVLRRLGCSNCYMCEACTSGFGRLAGAFFGRGFVRKESVGNRVGLVAFIYVLLLPVPVALLVLSKFQFLAAPKVLVLISLLVFGACSFTIWFRHSAVDC